MDLGTTWTAAVLADGDGVRPVALGTDDHPSMPSVVAFDGERVVVGAAAERVMQRRPDAGAREVKRRFGDTTPLVLDGRTLAADQVTLEMLRHVARVACPDGWTDVQLVLTHPANWGAYKLELLQNVAEHAGFASVQLVPEPVAAALEVAATGRVDVGDVVAVYDFGGGTFDATVVRVSATPEVIGQPAGLERLGGIDIDQLVLTHVLGVLDVASGELDVEQPAVRSAVAELRLACTAAKEALSADSDVTIPVALPNRRTEVRLTRTELESMLSPRIDETLASLDRVLAGAGVTADALRAVVLVGGSAQIPVVGERVRQHTGRPTVVGADPKLVVAGGALRRLDATGRDGSSDESDAPLPPPPGTADGEPRSGTGTATAGTAGTAGGASGGSAGSEREGGLGGRAAAVVGGVAAAAAATVAGVVYHDQVADARATPSASATRTST
ncbi:MAG: Hsp70 family protein [Ilumatobacteraceae bacterium]